MSVKVHHHRSFKHITEQILAAIDMTLWEVCRAGGHTAGDRGVDL
jgi:hypothetical protein